MIDNHNDERFNLPVVLVLLSIGSIIGSAYTLLLVWWLS